MQLTNQPQFGDLKSIEESLRLSETRLRTILDNARQSFILLDCDLNILMYNAMADHTIITVMGKGLVENQPFLDSIDPDNRIIFEQLFQKALAGEKSSEEYIFPDPKGQVQILTMDVEPIFKNDRVDNIFICFTDTSEHWKTQEILKEREKRFKRIIEDTQAGYFFVDKDVVILDVNQAWLDIHGYSYRHEIIGKSYYQTIFEQDLPVFNAVKDSILAGEPVASEGRHRRKDGSAGYHAYTAHQVTEGQQVVGIEGLIFDITDRRRAELLQDLMLKISQTALSNVSLQELFQSIHQNISELLPAANFYIALYDKRTNILDFPYYVDQYDQPPLPAPPQKGLTEWVLRTKKPLFARPEIVDELVEKGEIVRIGAKSVDWLGVPLLLGDESIGVLVVQSYNPNERYSLEDLAILEFVSNQVAIVIDRKQSELRLQFLSTHDILTGLYNRVYFEEELTRLQQSRLFPISIVNMDVDGLKFVNDNLGHDKGDELLRRSAWLLKKGFRNEDMVARIGGDEFIVILPKTPEASANEVVNRLKNSIQNYNQNNTDFPIHLSIGIVTIEESSCDLREAIKLADQRMYDEKRRKKTGSLGS